MTASTLGAWLLRGLLFVAAALCLLAALGFALGGRWWPCALFLGMAATDAACVGLTFRRE